jgi:isopenicillin-N N-acyltransferase like protein
MAIEVLTLGDDPAARGHEHGRRLKQKIRDNIETYLRQFGAPCPQRTQLDRLGLDWADQIQDSDPEYYLEMEAIAAAADVPFAMIAMLNARYEIAYARLAIEGVSLQDRSIDLDGCTAFGVEESATRASKTFLGQNWDWYGDLVGRVAILRIRHTDRPSIVALTEAGVVGGKIGLNSRGIGLVINGLCTPSDGRGRMQSPFHVRCKQILEADRFDRAMRPILGSPHYVSANYMIGQWNGEMISIEASPNGHYCVFPQDGLLVHANHFVGPERHLSLLERSGPHTLFRDRRMRRSLAARAPDLDVADFRACLSDHYSYPASICRHIDERLNDPRRLMTVASVILDLTEGIMHVSDGPPCQSAYQSVELP